MTIAAQVEQLVDLGVPALAGITDEELRVHGDALLEGSVPAEGGESHDDPGAAGAHPLVVVHPDLVPTAALAPLMRRRGRDGFVVVDMTDLDQFAPTIDISVPDAPLYLVGDVTRGDDLLGWTPADAHAELERRGRTPLTIAEGVSWLLREPEQLEPGACFMCIGSRKRKRDGQLDARTPALWISGGTGRDGRERRGAPKLGWCWARNHHTWLGFASTAGRGVRRRDL